MLHFFTGQYKRGGMLECADISIKIKFFKYKEDRLWRQYSVSKKEEA